ncbi:neuroglian-like [Amblyomma americanum]
MTLEPVRPLPLLVLAAATVASTLQPSPPTMVKQPALEVLYTVPLSHDELDKPFLLECEAEGKPIPVYKWTKNGRAFNHVHFDDRITQQPGRGSLVFINPHDDDEGLYQCHAKNVYGTSMSNAVWVRKAKMGEVADPLPRVARALEGAPLSLECEPPVGGYPPPLLFWVVLHASGALRSINSSNLVVDPEGRLHFSSVGLDDQLSDAVYACVASSNVRREYKIVSKVQLQVDPLPSAGNAVLAPVQQYASSSNLTALRGHNLKLHCIYGGMPLPQITWSKRGTDILTSPERFDYDNANKTLEIKSVGFEDKGTYECHASNGVGADQKHTIDVKVEAAPYWLHVPNNTVAAEEDSVQFECATAGVPEPELQWFVNGVPIERAEPNARRKVEGSVLNIEALTKNDTAVYQCNASNPHGYAFRDFYLHVAALPPFIVEAPPQLTQSAEASHVTLRCRVLGSPRPVVKWKKDDQELTEGGRHHILDSGDLRIDTVLLSDRGRYTCDAYNRFGNAAADGLLEVKQRTRIIQPPEDYEAAVGKAAKFQCRAMADPTLELAVGWLFSGQSIDFEADPRLVLANDNTLIITRVTVLDSGVYTCVANTELDSDRAQATLIVQDVPQAPEVKRVVCERRTALLEWKPRGDGGSPILSYIIQYNTSFSHEEWENAIANIPATDTAFRLSLSPWTNCTFRVVARNKIGLSAPSDPSSTMCTTPEDVPYRNPDSVVGCGDRPDNLVIKWKPMPLIDHNAPGFFYKVLWKRHEPPGNTWHSQIVEDWTQNMHVVKGLPPFTAYRIRVEAYNRMGQALTLATEVIGYSGEDAPLEKPKDFKLIQVIGPRSAELSWSPVSAESVRGHFRGYKVQTWTPEEGEGLLREVVVAADKTTAQLNVLRPYARNVVRVLAFNNKYNGPPSETVEFTTPEDTPGPVDALEGISMGSTGLYLTWKQPQQPNGVLTGYHIYYQEIRGTSLEPERQRLPPVRDPLQTKARLTGLRPNTVYRITVRAATALGPGERYYIELRTGDHSERVPDVPNFKWAHIPDSGGNASIKVTWLPSMSGHSGNAFYVQYRHHSDEEWLTTPLEPNEDSILLEGLEAGTLYELRVVTTDGGLERASDIEEVQTGGLDVPGEPQITVTRCDGLEALVQWKAPEEDSRAPILSYTLQYSTSFSPDNWENAAVDIPPTDTELSLPLSPWANYTFRAIAHNKVGPSVPSGPSSTCRTPEDVPHRNPDRVEVSRDRSQNMVITWTPMLPIEHNAPGFFYKVLWKREDLRSATWNSHVVEDWTINMHVVRVAPLSKAYRIRIEAQNHRGPARMPPIEVIGSTENSSVVQTIGQDLKK